MRFRTGLLIGLGVGYVLGAKAGRERYEQIQQAWERLQGNELVEVVAKKTAEITETPRNTARQVMSNGLRSASSVIQDRTAPRTDATG